MNGVKDLYKGIFESRTTMYIERCYATSLAQAKQLLMRRIAKKTGAPLNLIMDRFKDNKFCDIQLEIEFKEVEE